MDKNKDSSDIYLFTLSSGGVTINAHLAPFHHGCMRMYKNEDNERLMPDVECEDTENGLVMYVDGVGFPVTFCPFCGEKSGKLKEK